MKFISLPNRSGRTRPQICNRNEYIPQAENDISGKYNMADALRLTILPPTVNRFLNPQSSILNISQSYRPPRPVTGNSFTFFYVDDICTSQETHLCASTACYRE
jgi:hypothetical protein